MSSSPRHLNWTASDTEVSQTLASGTKSTRFLTAEDLDVHFQPIVSIATGRVFAQEALVRCKLPEYRNPAKLFERAVEEKSTGRLGRPIRDVAFARGADSGRG